MKKFAPLVLLVLSACGTIFNGSNQDISFDSNQQGVQIYINGMKACKTPCVYPLDRQAGSFVISAKKQGFEEQQQIIEITKTQNETNEQYNIITNVLDGDNDYEIQTNIQTSSNNGVITTTGSMRIEQGIIQI